MRKLILTLAVLSVAVFAAIGCGKDEAASGASALVPAGAVIYGEFTLDPGGDQEKAVNEIVSKFPGQGSAGERIQTLLEKGLKESDAPISYKDDIEPWLGDEAAFFVTGQMANSGAVLIAADDEDKAREALDKAFKGKVSTKTYKDVEYTFKAGEKSAGAVFDGFLVVGTEAALKDAIDTSDGGSPLEDDDAYGEATDGVSDDRLGLFYLNTPAVLKTAEQTGALPDSFKKYFKDPLVATVDADSDGVVFEGTIPEDLAKAFAFFGKGSELVTELPADSWLAMAQPDFGRLLDFYVDAFAGAVGGRDTIEQQLKGATGLDLEQDVLGWMGDFAIFVRGTSVSELDGALIIETKDEAASGRLLRALERLASGQIEGSARLGPLSAPGGGEGFTVQSDDVPKPVHVFQRAGRVVFAYGNEAAGEAVKASQPLGDSAQYTEATASLDGYDISFYVAVEPILQLVDATGAADDADWQDAKAYLEPLSALVGGTSGDGDDLRSAVKLVVK